MTLYNAKNRPIRRIRQRRYHSKLATSILILVILATGIFMWTSQNYLWRLPASTNNNPLRALIIDQLSLTYPGTTFTTNVTDALTGGGYRVDYIGPSTNAIDYFRDLPTKGYDLIIIRAHASGDQSIITTEPYSQTKYVSDQEAGTLVAAELSGLPLFFALTPKFVRQDMQGRFGGSTIVVMGCGAPQGSEDLAAAFLDRGATFFVGWDGSVTILHTDTSTVALTRQLASGKNVPVATTLAGTADPVYGAHMRYLDWDTLVHGRMDAFVSQLAFWVLIGSLLVLGPLTVFAVPKLFDLADWAHEKTSRRKKTNPQSRKPEPSP